MDLITGNEGDDSLTADEVMIKLMEATETIKLMEAKVDILIGGLGSDTFICDQFDTIFDYNLIKVTKGGACSILHKFCV
jgi:hypothetical protein